MWLDETTRLLEEGRPAAALEAMLDAWRVRRIGALADLIDTLSDALTAALPKVEGKTRNARQTAWLDLLNERRDVDLGRLLAVFPEQPFTAVGVRIERLAQHDDPRVARAFADLVREPPTIAPSGRGNRGDDGSVRALALLVVDHSVSELISARREGMLCST